MDRVRTYGLGGAGGVLVIATVVFAIGSRSGGDPPPPEALPRGLVIGLLLAVPALIAAIGVRRRDAVLFAGAGGASLAPAWLSIATIPLVIPALMLLIAGGSAVRPARARRWLVALALVGLQVGAIFALFGTTEQRCWLGYDSPSGLVYRPATEAKVGGPMGLPGGPVAGGCDGGALTERGVAMAGVLAIGALAVAFGAPRPRPLIPA